MIAGDLRTTLPQRASLERPGKPLIVAEACVGGESAVPRLPT